MKKLLWLDDFRNPFGKFSKWVKHFTPDYYKAPETHEIHWVKTYGQFVGWIETNGLPDKIAFDHDLADEHYAPQEVYAEEKYNEWQKTQEFKEKTGLDCAKWLVEYCMDNEVEMPSWVIQSANPNGAKNIQSYLLSYLKSLSIDQDINDGE